MARINQNFKNLSGNYLFSEINRRVRQYTDNNREAKILRLGIGNTTQPLPVSVIRGMTSAVKLLGNVETYTGYGDEQGNTSLRQAVAEWYGARGLTIDSKEVFISDGAKSDSAAIATIFGQNSVVAITDPVYPVYLDSNIIAGNRIIFMKCSPENGFFPKLPKQKVDLIYICSPNNPTGSVATHKQLQQFVDYALKNQAVIIFDAAYSEYIQDKDLPRSIYEVKGALKCAIEIQSFSKAAGFTGVRLGWTIVPNDLVVEGTITGEVNQIWNRRQTTMFNGASNIAQAGGLTVLSKRGQSECQEIVNYYLANAQIIRTGLENNGLEVYGGINAPYIWVKTPDGNDSWQFFDQILNDCQVVCTPGIGFGAGGEGYIRLSAFGERKNIEEAVHRIIHKLRK